MDKDATGSYIWGFHAETPSERKLAAAMRKAGLRFGQEVPVKGFTVDFLLDEWLIVEVDGETHLSSTRAAKDARRQAALEAAGFTVLRVPASELSTDRGLKGWVAAIRRRVKEGPPYLKEERFGNLDYKRKLAEIREALRQGETEHRKREAMASAGSPRSGPSSRSSRELDGDSETMEAYFGKEGQDFASMLAGYDWSHAPVKDDAQSGDAGEGHGGKNGSRKTSAREGSKPSGGRR